MIDRERAHEQLYACIARKNINVYDVIDVLADILDDEWLGEVYEAITNEPAPEREDELTEPAEDDWVTTDYVWFAQQGSRNRIIVPQCADWRKVLKARMDQDQFWPNVWFISDHGNAHLLSLED